jgi:transposase
MRVSPWIVSDGLWERLEPLLPRRQRRFRYPGRKPLEDRLVLKGILFVLHTGIGWEHLPQESRLRLRDDRVASPACVAGGRGVGAVARAVAGRAARRR